jgi:hypothetical protein
MLVPMEADVTIESSADDQLTAGFDEIYGRVVEYATARYARVTDDIPVLSEPASTARYSVLGIPEDALLGIPADRDFVVACFAKLFDRLPTETDVAFHSQRLRMRLMTRKGLIEFLRGSDEYHTKGVRVELVPSDPE